jgi:mitochondrial fission process protein 1
VALSRAFRYLAFTSDFGEALRPVIQARIVTGTYLVAISYCVADVGWEAYKLHKRGYVTEHNEPMSMAQCVMERTAFQAIASIIVPAAVIHTTVDVSRHLFKRIGRFNKWGPSVMGLAVIPFLPLYLDHPVESGLEWFFANYGPWAKKPHQD